MLDVVRVLEGMDLFTECVFGLDKCSDHFPCPLHHKWFRIRKEISEMMASTNFAQLALDTNTFDFRIKTVSVGTPI